MITREIYITRDNGKVVIDYVQNTNLIPIVFNIADYAIPSNASAFAYVKKVSGLEVFSEAEVEGNTITINLSTQMVAELGNNILQVLITSGGKVAATFAAVLHVEKNISDDSAVESQNEYSALESLITQANATLSAVNAATQAANSAATSAGNAADAANDIADEVEQKLNAGDFSASVTIGTTTTGEPGTNASVTNSGTDTNAVLNFTIPRGDTGSVENIEQQTVTFSEASTRQNIASGETLATIFGKIKKFFSDTDPLLDDSGWITITPTGNYKNIAAHPLQVRKKGNLVELSGAVRNTVNQIGGSTTEVTMGVTLDAEYRPSKMVVLTEHTETEQIYQLRVNTNGTVTASRSSVSGDAGYTSIPANTAIFIHAVYYTD